MLIDSFYASSLLLAPCSLLKQGQLRPQLFMNLLMGAEQLPLCKQLQ